jgi:malate dehydrogenase (oxaloacetate-decarboxylating)
MPFTERYPPLNPSSVHRVMPPLHPSASYSLQLRLANPHRPGMVARIADAIADVGGLIGAIDVVDVTSDTTVRDFTISAGDTGQEQAIIDRLEALDGVRVLDVADRTFQVHLGGKFEIAGRCSVKTRDDLSMIYTPGVARVCQAIYDAPARQWDLTVKSHTIAVVSDGTAVLGLGDIGPAAAQPVMEGKCLIFKAFGGIDAVPICLATRDPDEIVDTVQRIAPVFGGVNLEDISAPRCFDIEDRLQAALDIPVMHDDQHGTAIVVLAALTNSLRIVDKPIASAKIVIAGAGAAGSATARILMTAGARNVVVCDRSGALYDGRAVHMNAHKAALSAQTNPDHEHGNLAEVLRGADVFIGLSGPGLLTANDVRSMASDSIVFAMANPIPEIMPEELNGLVRVMATGRSDYPNQINNSLAFPGVFRGALDVRARAITQDMKLAAASAIADLVSPAELHEDYVIPGMFDSRVVERVSTAVRAAACASGVARAERFQRRVADSALLASLHALPAA